MNTPIVVQNSGPDIKEPIKKSAPKKEAAALETAASEVAVPVTKPFNPNPTKEEIKKMSREEVQQLIRYMRDRDSELITGIFSNKETPASSDNMGAVRFVYAQYPGEKLDSYELWDGHRYSLPRGLVRRLKNECYLPIRERVSDPIAAQQGVLQAVSDGRLRTTQHEMKIVRKKHRFSFEILDYMDYELEKEMRPVNVIQVTY